jgi:hypothetical protein
MNQKDRLTEAVKHALEEGTPLVAMVRGKDMTALALQGDPQSLSFLIVEAMRQDPRIEQVISIAVKAFNAFKGKDKRPPLLDLLEALIDFKPLDCENCPVADDCEVRDEIICGKEMPEELRDLLKEVFNSKGGDK